MPSTKKSAKRKSKAKSTSVKKSAGQEKPRRRKHARDPPETLSDEDREAELPQGSTIFRRCYKNDHSKQNENCKIKSVIRSTSLTAAYGYFAQQTARAKNPKDGGAKKRRQASAFKRSDDSQSLQDKRQLVKNKFSTCQSKYSFKARFVL